MFKRKRMTRNKSRKLFSKTAQWIHPKNVSRHPMRGGYRL